MRKGFVASALVLALLALLTIALLSWEVDGQLAGRKKSREELAREKAEDREKLLKQNRASRANAPPKPKRARIDAKPVFAIDLGTESTKVVVVDPNNEAMMFDMTVNELSNRKTPTAFGFDPQTKQVVTGESAKALYFRYPANALLGVKRLIGESFKSDRVKTFQEDHPYAKLVSEGDYIQFQAAEGEDATFSVEEIVAFLYQASKVQAEDYVKTPGLNEVILTVPAYYTTQQRQIVEQIANAIAGIEKVSLINELTAVAIDYSSRRTFEQKQHVVFLDIGSHAASAVVVELSNPSKGVVKVKVLGSATNHELNGYKFDTLLTDILAKDFDSQHKALKASVKTSPRAMVRLRSEAQSIKEQLSASNLVKLELDSLHEGFDFKTSIKRDLFEEKAATLFALAPALVEEVLRQANLNPSDLSAIEYFGGGVRIPKLQTLLQEKFSSVPIGQHVNGEEAAVFGAGIYLATTKKWSTFFEQLIIEDLPSSQQQSQGEGVQPLVDERLKAVKAHYDKVVQRMQEHAAMIEAKNKLESYVYETKENLDTLLKGASEEELEGVREHFSGIVDWMDEVVEAESTAEDFEDKMVGAKKVLEEAKVKLPPPPPPSPQPTKKEKKEEKSKTTTKGKGKKKGKKDEL